MNLVNAMFEVPTVIGPSVVITKPWSESASISPSLIRTPSIVTPLPDVFSLILSTFRVPVVVVPAPEIPAFATSIP